MAALDFPTTNADGSPLSEGDVWKGPNGVTYTYRDGGAGSYYWQGVTGEYTKDSNANIHVGDSPPVDPEPGDLWWDSSDDSGRLYMFYKDADSEQWVETSPSGSGEDGEPPLWDKNGNDLEPKVVTDNVVIGGDKISLNSNGLAKFASNVECGPIDPTTSGAAGARLLPGGALQVQKQDTAASDNQTVISYVRGTNTNVPFSVKGDGSATFASTVTTGDGADLSVDGVGSALLVGTKASTLTLKSNSPSATANALNVYSDKNTKTAQIKCTGDIGIGGILPDAPNISLNADGSAQFAGEVRVGNSKVKLQNNSDRLDILAQSATGSAELGATLTVSQNVVVIGSSTSTGIGEVKSTGSSVIYCNKQDGNLELGVRKSGTRIGHMASVRSDGVFIGNLPTNPNISLNADGSADFLGNVNVGRIVDGTAAFRLREDGAFWAKGVYGGTNSTTSANVGVFSDGQLRRITSSAKYKTDIEDITDENADKALELRPVWYRSLCEGDEGKSSYGFIAEEVAQVDPRLASYDAEGNPDGVNYAMLVVHLTDIAQRQQARIAALEEANAAFELRLAALEGVA